MREKGRKGRGSFPGPLFLAGEDPPRIEVRGGKKDLTVEEVWRKPQESQKEGGRKKVRHQGGKNACASGSTKLVVEAIRDKKSEM